MSVAVVRIGVGNTASVMFALERLGVDAVLTGDAATIQEAERVILPGVGAAAYAMRKLEEAGLIAALRAYPRPLLGICLGQQLLYAHSEEGDAAGFALIPGDVAKLPASAAAPAPHMGWSKVFDVKAHALTEGIEPNSYAYFVHSYVCPLSDATLASAAYGQHFSAMVARGNVYGCQFHPERSGAVGRRILQNFLALPC
jgi:imidazole glycerol-phosphate synthase subunit HisH